MKNNLIIGLLLCCISSFAKENKQKIEVKDDVVSVDGNPEFILAKMKLGGGSCNYYLKNLQGKKLAFFQDNYYNDPKDYRSQNNPYGNVYYYTVTFVDSGSKTEIFQPKNQVKLAELLVKQNVVVNGEISDDAQQEFIMLNGEPFSKKAEAAKNNTIIINNNNNPEPAPGSRVNINIGH